MARRIFEFSNLFLLGGVLVFLTLALCSGVDAQTVTGTLQGTVTDSKGAVIPGADVTIRNSETGQLRNVKTNGDGFYSATFLPIGRYSVTASATGFSKVSQENVEVTLNQTRVVELSLAPSGVTEAVVVTSDLAPINTTNAEIKGSLNAQEIMDKPTFNQGSFLTLAETFTGFQENPTSGQNNPTASSGSSVNFNGTGTRGATFQINGVNNDDSSENQNRQGASLSTIKEFQVITNNFAAEFGRGYGAVVLVQTKSGTNNLHGDVYWYHNDSTLNATNNVFAPGVKKGVTRRNQFGFTSGFPIFKDKLFSFISLDHTENTGANNYNRDVFTMAERNPANWFLQTPANDTPANRAFIQSVIERYKNAVPNDPAAGPRVFRGQQGFDFPARDYSGRLDWNPRESDNVTARWQYTRQKFVADDIIIGERADQNHKQQNFGTTWTHLFSSSVVGEFRYGLGLRTTLVNIAAGNDTPILRFFNPSPITTQSSIGSAGNFPIQRYQTDNQFVYNLTMVFGSHQIKTGTDIRHQQLNDLADNFSRGFYNSTTATCNTINYGNGFNQFLNGCTPNFQKGYGPFFLENRIPEANFYFEDSWKVRDNLTLILGLRYEYVFAPREVKKRIVYGFDNDANNIEPRFGFAWSPKFQNGFMHWLAGNTGDSVVRGGYGIFHGRLFQSVFSQGGATVRFNPPNAFFYNQSGAATAIFNPTKLADPTNGFVFVPGPQTARHTITAIDPGLEMPYTQQWNLTIERHMPFESMVRVSYSGNRGIGLLRYVSFNLPIHNPNGVLVTNHPNNAPGVLYTLSGLTVDDPRRVDVRGQVLRPASDILCAGTGLNGVPVQPGGLCPNVVPLGPLEYSFRVPRTNERRPDGLYATNLAVSNSSWSYYHGLQVEWIKRLSKNLNFQAAYTFSKAIDTTSEATNVGSGDSNINTNSARDVRALSRFHTPHRFTMYGTYRLPFFSTNKGLVGQVLGGWQFSAVMKLAKGTPFTVTTTGVDLNLDSFLETRPVLLDPTILGRSVNLPLTSQISLPRSAFRTLTTADFNTPTLGRNTFFLDGVKNVDFGVTKSFPMPWEGHSITLRADLFNAFNHVQYGFPSLAIANANFGAITTSAALYAPRNVLVSLRYQY
jgi:outer membrane receptor protein involved in Fe transport